MNETPPIPAEETPNPVDKLTPELPAAEPAGLLSEPQSPAEPLITPPPEEPLKTAEPTPIMEPKTAESRAGRFLRNALRLITLSLLMFAAGFLLAYFLLYQPTMSALETTRAELQTTAATLETRNADYTDLKGQYDAVLDDATKIEARASLALALRSLERANQGIVNKNNPVVRTQLQLARQYLDELTPYLEETGEKEMAAELAALMKSAETELVRDPQAVGPAVEKLMDALDSLEEALSLAP